MKHADLHTHSNFSDGALSPEQLVQKARSAGLDAIALTDHDITDGLDRARTEGHKINLEVINGIELSAHYQREDGENETEIHILGYLFDASDKTLQEKIRLFRQTRLVRAKEIVKRLSSMGVKLSADKVFDQTDARAVGRPHIARAMVEAGYVSSVEMAFHRYLGDDGEAYVPKPRFSIKEALSLIRNAGGISVVAHPTFGGPQTKQGWKRLVQLGLNGIEVRHSQHSATAVKNYTQIAEEFNLLTTGGSDFHAETAGSKRRLGGSKIPYTHIEHMRQIKAELDKKNNLDAEDRK